MGPTCMPSFRVTMSPVLALITFNWKFEKFSLSPRISQLHYGPPWYLTYRYVIRLVRELSIRAVRRCIWFVEICWLHTDLLRDNREWPLLAANCARCVRCSVTRLGLLESAKRELSNDPLYALIGWLWVMAALIGMTGCPLVVGSWLTSSGSCENWNHLCKSKIFNHDIIILYR
jgi:hypothetical protein